MGQTAWRKALSSQETLKTMGYIAEKPKEEDNWGLCAFCQKLITLGGTPTQYTSEGCPPVWLHDACYDDYADVMNPKRATRGAHASNCYTRGSAAVSSGIGNNLKLPAFGVPWVAGYTWTKEGIEMLPPQVVTALQEFGMGPLVGEGFSEMQLTVYQQAGNRYEAIRWFVTKGYVEEEG